MNGPAFRASDPGTDVPAGDADGLNPGLPGRLMFADVLVELDTGASYVPIDYALDDRLVTPTADGAEFFELVGECDYDYQTASRPSCMVHWNADGVKTAEYSLEREMRDRLPIVSPDASTIVVFIEYDGNELVILDRSPALIDMSRTDVADATWAPDGSLYYI